MEPGPASSLRRNTQIHTITHKYRYTQIHKYETLFANCSQIYWAEPSAAQKGPRTAGGGKFNYQLPAQLMMIMMITMMTMVMILMMMTMMMGRKIQLPAGRPADQGSTTTLAGPQNSTRTSKTVENSSRTSHKTSGKLSEVVLKFKLNIIQFSSPELILNSATG